MENYILTIPVTPFYLELWKMENPIWKPDFIQSSLSYATYVMISFIGQITVLILLNAPGLHCLLIYWQCFDISRDTIFIWLQDRA